MTYTFYLVLVKPSSVEEGQSPDVLSGQPPQPSAAGGPAPGSDAANAAMPKMYLRVLSMIEFDTFVATHGPGTYIDDPSPTSTSGTSVKRKVSPLDNALSAIGPPLKQQKTIYRD